MCITAYVKDLVAFQQITTDEIPLLTEEIHSGGSSANSIRMLSLVYYGGLFIITVMIIIILLLERKTDNRPKTACETLLHAPCVMGVLPIA